MPIDITDSEKVKEIISELKDLRTSLVDIRLKMARIQDRINTSALEMKRIESMLILAVSRETLTDGRPAYTDEWVKKALVEERLAQHERFCKLLKKHGLLQKDMARKIKEAGIITIKVTQLESEEKLLLS